MISAYRYIECSHDGASLYECLKCYNRFTSYRHYTCIDYLFCPYCGERWQEERPRPHKERLYGPPPGRPHFYWRLVKQSHGRLERHIAIDGRQPARAVLARLKYERFNDPGRWTIGVVAKGEPWYDECRSFEAHLTPHWSML